MVDRLFFKQTFFREFVQNIFKLTKNFCFVYHAYRYDVFIHTYTMFDSKNYTVRRMYIVALHSSSVRLPMLWRGRSGVLGTPESPRGLSREYSGILCVFFFFFY